MGKENNTKPDEIILMTTSEQWKHERDKIKEAFNTKQDPEPEIKLSKVTEIKKMETAKQKETSEKKVKTPSTIQFDYAAKNKSGDSKDTVKSKLKEIKSFEVFKPKEKKSDEDRGRKRELKKTETKEGPSLRSKSISTLKNAGQKIKSLTNDKLKNALT